MKKLSFVFLILATAIVSFSQTKVVTNKDLEKYRAARLAADKDLDEKYREMGYASRAAAEKIFEERRARNREYFERLSRERAATQNVIILESGDLRDGNDSLESAFEYLFNRTNPFYYSQPQIYPYGYYAPYGFGFNSYLKPQKSRPPRSILSPRSLNPVVPRGSSIAVPARRPVWNAPRRNPNNFFNSGRRRF